MDEKVLPLMITTYATFCACMEKDVKAIYICVTLFETHATKIYRALEERGYELPGLPLQEGVLFVRGIAIEQCVLSNHYDW